MPINRKKIKLFVSNLGKALGFGFGLVFFAGCAAIYGWNIHAPGLLSSEFARDIPPVQKRVALYIPEGQKEFISKDKGTMWSDPQTYYIGEAFVPMLIEAFQSGFSEFILMEAVPNPDLMDRYQVDALVVSEIKGFKNRKTLPAQGLDLYTETTVFSRDLKLIRRFEARGTSEAKGTFAKKGGLEVNLNAAIEGNLRETVLQVQEAIQ
jgi:hypothetical protein